MCALVWNFGLVIWKLCITKLALQVNLFKFIFEKRLRLDPKNAILMTLSSALARVRASFSFNSTIFSFLMASEVAELANPCIEFARAVRAREGGGWMRGCKAAFLFFTFLFFFAPPFRFRHGSPGGNGLSPARSICHCCLPCPRINSSSVTETRVASLIGCLSVWICTPKL